MSKDFYGSDMSLCNHVFAIVGPTLWNQLPPLTRSILLTGQPSASFRSLKAFSSIWVSRTGSASDWCALQEALYKCTDTIEYAPEHKVRFQSRAEGEWPSR